MPFSPALRKPAILIVILVLVTNLGIWAFANRPQAAAGWTGELRGVSYTPYQREQSPLTRREPTAAEIDRDLALLAGQVRAVRTYGSRGAPGLIPGLAERHGLQVTAGAWLDTDRAANAQEIAALLANVARHPNIERVIVGNEAVLREDLSVRELADYLREVRRKIPLPVSTAEPWHVWIEYPELALEVDYIAAHLLPYWEDVPADNALAFARERYRELREAFPDKPILIAEVGWPSNGNRRNSAEPGLVAQARFIREFLVAAETEGMDYFVMEAFDQPWKRAIEGSVGAYWGLWNADREPKFAMQGPVRERSGWTLPALLAALLALVPMIWFALRFNDLKLRGQIFYAALIQAGASLLVWTAFVPTELYLSASGQAALAVLLPAQFALLLVALINGFEFTEVLWNRGWKRPFRPLAETTDEALPKVSIHLACYNEPPEMVKQTLDHLAALDYPDFEVLVVDNNTRDPAVWQPLREHCERLGPRFRFFHLEPWPGYKAGALNYALSQTDPEAAIIGVIDSDYLVDPQWLRGLIPHFADARIGFVQAPQDHYDWRGDTFKTWCNWEYAGFFNIGMVHRNERDAIIQHGTMTLIRREALEQTGRWAEWCICEDSELGLRLMEAGYSAAYVTDVMGRGVTPDNFAAYKGQRFRWAYGAVQILKRYWRWMLPGHDNGLTGGQRFHFITGWLPWFADALHLIFTWAALLWSIGLVALPGRVEFPLSVFLLPTFGMFAFKVMHSFVLYRARVDCPWHYGLGAAIAGMGLTHTIARAIFTGLFSKGRPFLRTPKGENSAALVRGLLMAREEGLLFAGMWVSALLVALSYDRAVAEVWYWVAIMLIQSIPYGAAVLHSVVNALPRTPADGPQPATS